MRSVASELSIEWPPSMPISEPMRPALNDALDVGGRQASSKVSGQRCVMRCTMSICSSVARTASLPCIVDGHVHRPELAAHAALAQARDVGHQRRHRLGDVGLAEVTAGVEPAERPRVVVVPVDERRLLVNRPRAGQQIPLRIIPATATPTITTSPTNAARMNTLTYRPQRHRDTEISLWFALCLGVSVARTCQMRSSVSRRSRDCRRLTCSVWPLAICTS